MLANETAAEIAAKLDAIHALDTEQMACKSASTYVLYGNV